MATIFNINKKTFSIVFVLVCLFIGFAATGVHAAANDSSITLKKDPSSGLFTLTVKDPDGVQEFSMTPAGKFSYGGGLSGCPKTFSNNNVLFSDPSDFEPVMPAFVIDCKNNTTSLEIAPPKNGLAKSTLVAEEESPLPPPVSREAPQEEKKSGPLSANDIRYPVPELGNCQSEKECRSYCDNSERAKECFAFAKKYNLISEKEAEEAEKKFFEVKKGPGGCDSGVSCEAYCNNVDRLDECIAFAEESGYYTGNQLAEAKKFQELVKNGTEFPGGCKDRNACELYCNDAGHMEECLNFAEKTGVMPKEEIEQARKILPLIKSGETPGGCVSKEQCEKYCSEDSHSEECIAFGEKAGFISPEDAAMIKKTGGKGPGGCHSKQQCESYCEANSDACFQWAQENGLMSEADLAKMKKGLSQFKEQLEKVPPEVTQCLKDAVGEENFQKLSDGQPIFDRSLEGKMKSCFSEITAQVSQQLNTLPPEAVRCIKDTIGEDGLKKLQSGESDENVDFSSLEGCFRQIQSSFGGGPGGPGGPGGFSGPGDCTSIDECTAYCQEEAHQDECQKFVPPGGGGPGGPGGGQGGFHGGPGGCTSQEECMAYCKDHQEECQNFAPPGGGQGGQGQQHDGFSECGIVPGAVASYVCGINGRDSPESGVETTYFNRCHAEQQGAEILREGECSKQECSDIADPVCGNDNNSWTSPCNAQKHGGVKHKGVCTSEDFGGSGGSGGGGGFSGPGGCQSEEECQAYCQAHPAECSGGGGTPPPPYPTSSCAPLPSGLVSWWDDTLSDASGGVTITPGKVGDAFKFDGSGYIDIGNLASLNFGTGPFSFEVWFLWNGGEGVHNIIRKSNYPVSGPGAGYWLRIGANNLEFFTGETVGIDGGLRGIVTTPVSSGTWYHIAATRDSSGIMSLYRDGQLTGTANALGANTTSEAPFTIGAWDDRFGVTELFSGILDEVTVYNRALSASEVKNIFNAGSAGKCTVQSSPSDTNYQQEFQQQYDEQYQQQYQQTQPPTNFSGPGGCKSAEECQAYCTQNYQDPACQQIMPPSPSSVVPFSSFLGAILGPWLLLMPR